MELPVVPLAGRERALQASRSAEMKWGLRDKIMGGWRVHTDVPGKFALVLFDSQKEAEAFQIAHVLAGDARLIDFEAVEEKHADFKYNREWDDKAAK